MQLRKLNKRDAKFMYEWMHDDDVIKYMQTDFACKTMEDCYIFIKNAQNITENLHLAIVDECDEYMGTVSLKHITEKNAEFAITIRKKAMGKGYSKYGMREIIKVGFEKLNLSYIYWCVNPINKRAVKFYDKNGYTKEYPESLELNASEYTEKQIGNYIWYRCNNL